LLPRPSRPHPTEESHVSRFGTASGCIYSRVRRGPAAVNAQGVVTTHKLSAALANQLVGDSVANCAKNGYKVVAVVVDLDGVRQALLRGDGAADPLDGQRLLQGVHDRFARAGTQEETTKAIADRMAKAPPSTVPQTPLPNVTYAQGAVAIMAGGQTIGGLA
jgi:uncharacterized protein GlcG (DUF336 family)